MENRGQPKSFMARYLWHHVRGMPPRSGAPPGRATFTNAVRTITNLFPLVGEEILGRRKAREMIQYN